MNDHEILRVGLALDQATVDEAKKEASGVAVFGLGFVVGAVAAAAVTYFWLENESRTVYTDRRAHRYGRRPG